MGLMIANRPQVSPAHSLPRSTCTTLQARRLTHEHARRHPRVRPIPPRLLRVQTLLSLRTRRARPPRRRARASRLPRSSTSGPSAARAAARASASPHTFRGSQPRTSSRRTSPGLPSARRFSSRTGEHPPRFAFDACCCTLHPPKTRPTRDRVPGGRLFATRAEPCCFCFHPASAFISSRRRSPERR
jgi:hypothetical protein